jgi:hypothetical protein
MEWNGTFGNWHEFSAKLQLKLTLLRREHSGSWVLIITLPALCVPDCSFKTPCMDLELLFLFLTKFLFGPDFVLLLFRAAIVHMGIPNEGQVTFSLQIFTVRECRHITGILGSLRHTYLTSAPHRCCHHQQQHVGTV